MFCSTKPSKKMMTEILDPDGDVTITCGDTSFRVCSKALSLASPVFAVMLKPSSFREGMLTGDAESANSAVISLPEEYLDAFRMFANLAHHRLSDAGDQPSVVQLDNLALFIAKYDCTNMMKDRGNTWISRTLAEGDVSQEQLWLLLHLAYVLDLDTLVSNLSRTLVQSLAERIRDWEYARANMRTFPDGFLAQLDHIHHTMTVDMEETMIKPIIALSSSSCEGCRAMLSNYIRGLAAAGILRATNKYRRKSVPQILQSVATFGDASYSIHAAYCIEGQASAIPQNKGALLDSLRYHTERAQMCQGCLTGGENCRKHRPGGWKGAIAIMSLLALVVGVGAIC
ncbi:BTB/POZ domain-containing protein [Aspergillus mulundensis]|uniref:Uncharacterized protein n=1 Tax=Aspergillus mulundensis TaxID=1810919 RepID=A0A3D8QBW8_9EURO|nr:hypothetical protein DSM5745_11160 [Aspergillus mulundensis]RDW58954.1 hypothetical protein DSM5745_11160 [Aspergillus mulundensis]